MTKNKPHKIRIRFILSIALIVFLTPLLNKEYHNIFPPTTQPKEQTAIALLMNLLGEFRTSIAALFYIKSEEYFHELEAMQNWKEQTETMPLFRLVTLLDPHMIQAYDVASYHLAVDLKKVQEGLDFLNEGLANNPNNPELHFTAALIHFMQTQNYEEAVNHAKIAQSLAADATMLANIIRIKAYALYRQKKFHESLESFQELLKLLQEDSNFNEDDPAISGLKTKISELKQLLSPTN